MNSAQLRTKNVGAYDRITAYLERVLVFLVGTFIFFNPFPHTTSVKEICLYLSVAVVLTMILLGKEKISFESPLTLPFTLYALWSFASIFWAIDKENSLHDFRAHLLKMLFIYYMVINFFDSKKRIAAVAWIIIISTAIFAIKGKINYYVLGGNSLSARLIPVDGAPINSSAIINLFAVFLSVFYLTRKNKWFIQIILCICLAGTFMGVILSYSRAALLGLGAAAVVLFFLSTRDRKRLIAILILIIAVPAILYSTSGQTRRLRPERLMNDFRLAIYYTTIEIAKDYPIAGVGFGMEIFEERLWKEYNPKVPTKWQRKDPASSPHSFFFSILIRLGIVGIIIFCFLIFRAFLMSRVLLGCERRTIRVWGSYLLASFVGMLIAGLFGSILHGAAAYNFYIVLGMMTVLWRLAGQSQKHDQLKEVTAKTAGLHAGMDKISNERI